MRFKVHRFPGGSRTEQLHLIHPQEGSIGSLQYVRHPDHLQVELLKVKRQHRGQGYAGQLMDELQRRNPGTPVDHGERTEVGQDWWDAYSFGKDIQNGRTMASKHQAVAVLPHQRLFGPTYGLDHRLFDGEKLRPEIRKAIILRFDEFCQAHHYRQWDHWAKIVFFGSEASNWSSPTLEGNNDFDLSIGIEYTRFRAACPEYFSYSDEQIAAGLTEEMHTELNDPNTYFDLGDGSRVGPMDETWFANLLGWDITQIRPYAAYDVVRAQWIVRPPNLPDWDISQFPEGHGLVREIQGVIEMARGVLSMPEPYRTQNGDALWHFVHDNRSGAFGPQGEGWYDPRNVLEKACDQKGLMRPLFDCHARAVADPHTLDAPEHWSNDPRAP